MTDTAIIALGTATATVIAALTAAIVAIAALRKTTTAAAVADKKADIIIEKAVEINEKAVEIHTLTNSRMAKVTADLEVALAKISGLEKRLIGMNDAKVVADQVAAKLADKVPPIP